MPDGTFRSVRENAVGHVASKPFIPADLWRSAVECSPIIRIVHADGNNRMGDFPRSCGDLKELYQGFDRH